MPLKGVKVLEFVGLAPGPFCGKILADFGATVTRIDKVLENHLDVLQHGKRTLAVNLKDHKGQQLVRQLVAKYDVIIEPFRPGVMEKLNLGPDLLCKEQPRLIYARLTGFGQTGRLAARAGHDINYAAISGVLSMLGRRDANPTPPINLLADFAGGGLMCALGICLALLERYRSGRGQIVDAAMIDGAAYVASWLFMSRSLPIWSDQQRGTNALDSGAYFYDTYKAKDGKYMSVGALEPAFFELFKTLLGLPELSQFLFDEHAQAAAKETVRQAFSTKTQAEWSEIFEDVDACVYPVVEWQDVMQHQHNNERKSFQVLDDVIVPKPAPRLSRTPAEVKPPCKDRDAMDNALSILRDLSMSKDDLEKLIDEQVLLLPPAVAEAKL